jgi:MoxR-like ATPase
MNPPSVSDETHNYSGSQPLDSALADRYAFIVRVPDWCDFNEGAQRRLLLQDGGVVEAEAERLRQLVDEARPLWRTLRQQLAALLTDYVRCVAALLQEAGIRLSPRRLAVLMRNIAAVHAVRWILGQGDTDLGGSARLALIHSIPLPAEGIPAPEDKLESAHKEAWHAVTGERTLALIRIYSERDPVRRAVMAAQAEEMDLQQRSVIVADCLQFLRDGARQAVAVYLMETGLAGRLMAPVAEEVAEDYAMIAEPLQDFFSTHDNSERRVAEKIQTKIAGLRGQDAGHQALANLLVTMFSADRLLAEADVDRICESWQRARAALASLPPAKS